MNIGPHPSHVLRFSMSASTYDEICVNCGAHDEVPGGWGKLVEPCPNAPGSTAAKTTNENAPDKLPENRRDPPGIHFSKNDQ
jgi:hypothetical protein